MKEILGQVRKGRDPTQEENAKAAVLIVFICLHWAEEGQRCSQGNWSSSTGVCSFQIYLDEFESRNWPEVRIKIY